MPFKLVQKFGLCLSLMILAACGGGEVQRPNLFPHDQSDLVADDAVEYGVLPNGLRYAVMSNATPSNTATLLMRIDTGSINEADDERGIAHFLEHMAFNGSENLAEGEMIKKLEKFGLEFGPDTNASTDFMETIYQLELPEVNDEIIDTTLGIMRETADRLTLDPDAIERERGIILSEKRARNSPAFRSMIASLEYYLEGSPFPDRIPIGTEDTINSVSADQFREFYEGYYRPDRTFIVMVGDFETDYAASKISEFFANWTAEGEALPEIEPKALEARGLDADYYVDPEIQTSIAFNVTGAPDLREDTSENRRDFYIESLGNRILSRRLSALAQTVDAPFIGAGARTSTVYDVVSVSSVNLSSKPDQWHDALAAGEQEIRRAYLYGFTQAELDEQLANTRKSLEVAVQTSPTRRTPGLARQILSSFGNDNVFTKPADDLEAFVAYADTITPDMVHEAFKDLWSRYETPQIRLSTSEIIENPEAQILDVFKASRSVPIEASEAEDLGEFAYTDFGKPGTVAERETIEDVEFETIRFDNNVRLNIKKTPYEKGVINLSVAFGQGELALPVDRPGLRWFAPNIMSVGGLEAHSADDIRTLMAGKTVGAGFSMGTERLYLTGSTTPDDLADQLNLMTAYLTAPGYRPESKARYEKLIESFYPTLDSTPGGVASRDISRLIRSGDTRFGIPDEDELLGVPMDLLKTWIKPSLTDSAIEIGIVGDVDIDAVIAEVGRTFGALPMRAQAKPEYSDDVRKLVFPQGQTRPVKLAHAGEPDTALLRTYWPSPDGTDDMTVRRLNLLQSMFKIRLNDVLREELGTTYSPSAFYSAPRTYPGFGYFAASMEVNPDDIDTAEAQIKKLAAEFKAGELDQDLFDRALAPIIEQVEVSLENNSYWMGVIGEAQSDPERVERHRRRATAYESITLDEVKALAANIFEPSASMTFHVVPEG